MTTRIALAHNLPLIASVFGKHLGQAGPKATSVALRWGPRVLRRWVAHGWVRRWRPDLAALALSADGSAGRACSVLAEALQGLPVHRPGPGAGRREAARRRQLAHAAVVLHELGLAERALTETESGDSRRNPPSKPDRATAIALSVVALAQGRLDAAAAHLDEVSGGTARRLRGRIVGQRQILHTELLDRSLREMVAPLPAGVTHAITAVLHVVSTALPEQQSGYTIRTHGMAAAQRASGLRAEVVTRLGFPVDVGTLGAERWASVDGVPYHHLLPRRGIPVPGIERQQIAVSELCELVQRLRPDVLHAHSKHENAQVALIVGRELGLPVVYEARGFLEETWASAGGDPASDYYRWSRAAETRCMELADTVVALSGAMASDIVGRGIDPGRVVVVPNAIPADFAAGPGAHASVGAGVDTPVRTESGARRTRDRLGIPRDATVFGSISTLNDYEGFDTVIEAMRLLADPTIVLLLVGTGPARSRLREVAEAAGVGHRLVLTGRVPHQQVRDYLRVIDVFVVPRKRTPVTSLVPPIKPLEAMALGVPVLVSDLPPLVEIARPGTFGELAAPDDPSSWAEQMAALRCAPAHAHDLGRRAREFVFRERTWACAADRYAEIYATAAHR